MVSSTGQVVTPPTAPESESCCFPDSIYLPALGEVYGLWRTSLLWQQRHSLGAHHRTATILPRDTPCPKRAPEASSHLPDNHTAHICLENLYPKSAAPQLLPQKSPHSSSALREAKFKNCGLFNSHIFLLFGIQEQQTLPFPGPSSAHLKALTIKENHLFCRLTILSCRQHQFTQFLPFSLMLVDLPSLSCRKLPMHPLRHMLDLLLLYLCFSFPNPHRILPTAWAHPAEDRGWWTAVLDKAYAFFFSSFLTKAFLLIQSTKEVFGAERQEEAGSQLRLCGERGIRVTCVTPHLWVWQGASHCDPTHTCARGMPGQMQSFHPAWTSQEPCKGNNVSLPAHRPLPVRNPEGLSSCCPVESENLY